MIPMLKLCNLKEAPNGLENPFGASFAVLLKAVLWKFMDKVK